MKVLIRFIRRLDSGAVEHHDRTFEDDRLTLGRGTGQDIHLRDRRVALEHAEIRKVGKGFEISTRGVSGITVNDSFCRKATLDTGDVVYIGSNILRIIPPPENFEFAFTFELDPEAREEEAERAPVRDELAGQAYSKRAWSWGLALVIIGLFLVVPLLVFKGGGVANALRGTPLPDDKAWLSGPLHPTHQLAIGDDCSACHQQPFVQVRDSACLECHADINHHVPKGQRKHEDMEAWRCQACHKEHNEPAHLVLAEDKLCADCHEDVNSIAAVNRELLAVGDFKDKHPQFRVSMFMPSQESPGAWVVQRIEVDHSAIEERSGLNFPHEQHLVAEGVPGPSGNRVLDCADCHQPELGGAFFRPVRMADHCASCHVLEFDEDAPGRAVPHADFAVVRATLEEYFANKLLSGRLAAQSGSPNLRIPGRQQLSPEQKQETLNAARELAAEKFIDLTQKVCAECHAPGGAAPEDAAERVALESIPPIRITEQWMPKAHFSHASHEGGFECGDCHAAASSLQSSDVLMPGIEDCRDCHVKNLASTCMSCHGFHLAGAGSMAEN